MHPDFFQNVMLRVLGLSLLLASLILPLTPALAQDEAAEVPPGEIQKTIDLLENDDRRQEIIKLLKLMAALEEQQTAGATDGEPVEGVITEDQASGPTDVKGYLRGVTGGLRRDIGSIGAGLRQSWRDVKSVVTALAQPWAVEIWRPYLLKAFIWGLSCLLVTWFIIRKYGQPPDACFSHN